MREEGGDKDAGFRFESSESTLVLSGWGFWTDEVARALGARVGEMLAGLLPGDGLVLNFEGLHPQRPTGEEALAVVLGAAKRRRAHVVVVVPNAITRLQLRRVAAGADIELTVATTMDEALAKSRAH